MCLKNIPKLVNTMINFFHSMLSPTEVKNFIKSQFKFIIASSVEVNVALTTGI